MTIKAIPKGYHSVTPYLVVDDVKGLMAFYQRAFDAQLIESLANGSGEVMHAEIRIGNSMVMMGAAREGFAAMRAAMYLYVEDTDKVYQQALNAGAGSLMPPADQFYGDRNAGVQDPAGNSWWIATHIEDVSPAELQLRAAEQMIK